jgi:ParB family chromosome partitioning protein
MGFYMESHLEGLVLSIREAGLLEPVVVCRIEDGYRILSGHYRVRAVRRLRFKEVLCRVVHCDARSGAVIYCTSNLLTRGLSAMEEAYMISRLVSEEKFTLSEIGKLWGRSKSWVSRRLALLLHLAPKLKKELGTGYLSPRVAQELMRLPQGNDQERVLDLIRKGHLNKDEAAELVTWWKTASQEERNRLEKEGLQKHRKSVMPYGTEKEMSRRVMLHLNQCEENLHRMTDIAQGQTDITWWPWEAYQSFHKASMQLEDVLECRNTLTREGNHATDLR